VQDSTGTPPALHVQWNPRLGRPQGEDATVLYCIIHYRTVQIVQYMTVLNSPCIHFQSLEPPHMHALRAFCRQGGRGVCPGAASGGGTAGGRGEDEWGAPAVHQTLEGVVKALQAVLDNQPDLPGEGGT